MTEITSVNNEIVKETTKLQQTKYRNQTGKFLMEGFKVIKEAFDHGIEIEKIFVKKGCEGDYNFAPDKIILTTESVLKKISTTQSAPQAVAVGFQKKYSKLDFEKMQQVVLLENIKDTGNLGTILRTAAAFGTDAIVLYGKETVDFYNPKTVRSAVGNLWKIPTVEIEDFEKLKKSFKNYNRIATLPHSKNLLGNFRAKKPVLLMFGSEADGLSEELIDFSTNSVKIEMADCVESLNLSISCAICMYEIFGSRNTLQGLCSE